MIGFIESTGLYFVQRYGESKLKLGSFGRKFAIYKNGYHFLHSCALVNLDNFVAKNDFIIIQDNAPTYAYEVLSIDQLQFIAKNISYVYLDQTTFMQLVNRSIEILSQISLEHNNYQRKPFQYFLNFQNPLLMRQNSPLRLQYYSQTLNTVLNTVKNQRCRQIILVNDEINRFTLIKTTNINTK